MTADPDSCSRSADAGDDPEPGESEVAIVVSLVSTEWSAVLPEAEALARHAARAALDGAGFAAAGGAELGLVLGDDVLLRRLNRIYRGIDRPTNVLAFPAEEEPADQGRAPRPPGPRLLGDVVLAAGTLQREAAEQSKTPADHLAHLVVHGVLHLLGQDHQDQAGAEVMETLERKVLAGLGIADPYRETAARPEAASAGH